MTKLYNALTFDDGIMQRTGSLACGRINYVGVKDVIGAVCYVPVGQAISGARHVYVDDLFDDAQLDRAIELKADGAELLISCCRTLYEVGLCDKRHSVTPIGWAHKLGLLENAKIGGAVCLDKDDIDLIIQSSAEVILTPSSSMGRGEGIPPVRMLLSLGAAVRLGSGEQEYNPDGDMTFEARLLSLAASGELRTKDALTLSAATDLCKL